MTNDMVAELLGHLREEIGHVREGLTVQRVESAQARAEMAAGLDAARKDIAKLHDEITPLKKEIPSLVRTRNTATWIGGGILTGVGLVAIAFWKKALALWGGG